MKCFMRQIIYDNNNIHLNFLASYANMKLNKESIHLINTLTDRQVVLYGSESVLVKLYSMLQVGITDETLLELLDKIGAGEQFEVLIQEGLIE